MAHWLASAPWTLWLAVFAVGFPCATEGPISRDAMKKKLLRPVARQSAETRAADSLRDYILSGAVPPGARLTEIPLAEQLGVARATLRSSLQRLVAEGIVVQTPYTGWHVTDLSEHDVWELWTLRGSLESLAARLAAETMTGAMRKSIKRAMAELITACTRGNISKASDRDFALHRMIVTSVKHTRLAEQYRQVELQVRFYIATSNALVADNLASIILQHEPMVEALLAADGQRAAQEAWRHNETEGKKLQAWLRSRSHAVTRGAASEPRLDE